MTTDQDFDPRIAWEAQCKHEWAPHKIMGAWERCENCGEMRDAEAPNAGDAKGAGS